MEFWGTEVTPGKPQVNEPGDDTYVHVSQAALGPCKDGGKSERVVIRVESGGKNVILGTLSTGKVDQMTLDLIFDREFKLSHTSTSSSVFFCGYRTDKRQEYDEESDEGEEDEGEDDEEDSDDEPVPLAVPIKENGTVSAKASKLKKQPKVVEQVVQAKSSKATHPKASLIDDEAEEGEESDDEGDDEDDDEDADKPMTMDFELDDYDEEDDSEFEIDDMSGSELESDEDESDSDEEDDEDSDDDDEGDVAAELGKKRSPKEFAKKSGAEAKKPRLDTPAKPGSQAAAEYWKSLIVAGEQGLITTPGKKGAKVASETKATPVSTKKSEAKGAVLKTPQKTPGKELKPKTPKTDKGTTPGTTDSAKKLGGHLCVGCNRNFATDSALSQHAVAKHKK